MPGSLRSKAGRDNVIYAHPYIMACHQEEGFLVEFSVQDPNTEEIWWRIKPKASELRYAGRLGGRGGVCERFHHRCSSERFDPFTKQVETPSAPLTREIVDYG
ncbi:hypothetical protein PAAG_11094 [Paracoccidioides lutzii Pb01]|uniref:Uncharacterized protein n=1 Tax=Paracoccidioides lutzii (strain ATCC MYA-826 / Pb01) TaxID=502779 RepID=A0A0A2V2Z8_PARBA|nr:hypothetical protein PAAG_11094 [Paracoccidioides lutzii Pb01]KGQ02141.1 hypothetical protein PAAG_11094 [Paracoccidioides lutzii Pb01]